MTYPAWQLKIRAAQRAWEEKQIEAGLKAREGKAVEEREEAQKLRIALKFFGIETPELDLNSYELDGFTFSLKWLQGTEKLSGVIRVSKPLGGEAWAAIDRGDYEPHLREMWEEISFNSYSQDSDYALSRLARALDSIAENHAANIADYEDWKQRELDGAKTVKSVTQPPTLDEQLVSLLRQLVQQEVARHNEWEC